MAVPPSFGGRGPVRSMPLPYTDKTGELAITDGIGALAGAGYQARQQQLDTRERIAMLEYDREAQEQAADFGVRFAQTRAEISGWTGEARVGAAAGAKGHDDAVRQRWDAASATLMEGVTNERARVAAVGQLADYGGRLVAAEQQWALGKRVEKLGQDAEATFDQQAVMARMAEPKAFGEEIARVPQFVASLGLGEDLSGKLVKNGQSRITRAYVEGWAERDAGFARQLLTTPAIATLIGDPDVLDTLSRQVGVEERRAAVEAAQATAAARSELRETISLTGRRLSAGIVIDDSELATLQRSAAAVGMDVQAFDLGLARARNATNKTFANASPVQIAERVNVLAAKADRASPEEQVELAQLRTLHGQRRAEWRDDPLGAGARAGYRVAPINWTDPATIAARATTAEAIAQQQGQPPVYLQPAEADQLRKLAAGGPAERLQAARMMGQFEGAAALAVARQVAPSDPVLQRAALLRPDVAALALNGAEARKANAALVPRAESQEAFDAFVGRALRGLPPDTQAGTIETARNIYGELARRNGGGEFGEQGFINAVNMALGRFGGRGGIGQWAGAPVLLPSGMSQAEFDQALAVPGELLRAASNGNPTYPGGQPVSVGDLRKRYRPVAIADGIYRFTLPSGAMLKAENIFWEVDLTKVDRAYSTGREVR